jgi:phage I-like protein
MTELEKANAAREAAEKRAADAEAKATQRLIEASFVAEASKLGVKHPEDAYRLADRSAVLVDDDGTVTGVAESVKALVDAGRLVMGQPVPPSGDAGAGGGQAQRRAALTAAEEAVASKMGLSAEDYAKFRDVKSIGKVEL